jgi:DNA-binding XRE family transcriptional regulator
MDDERIGGAMRAVRIRSRRRQSDVARDAGVPRSTLIAIERGRINGTTIAALRAVGSALGVRTNLEVTWNGADLDRLLAAGHARLHEEMSRLFAGLPDWVIVPELSFSIYGERGVIDIAAWHAATATLLIIELKTSLGDPQDLVATLDRRMRLAGQIVATRRWRPRQVGAWVAFADTRTNRRHVQRHTGLLRARLPDDGRRLRGWLRDPDGLVAALSFLTSTEALGPASRAAVTRRVRLTRAERSESAMQVAASDTNSAD